MNNPVVSILVPVYNREGLVGKCIQSALDQTFCDVEIIVVDNASTDGTLEICRQYASQDSRIRVFSNEENIGPVRNWKRCIAEARGKYGKMLFSDDLIEPGFLEKTLPFLEEHDAGFVFTAVRTGPEPAQSKVTYNFTGRTGMFPGNDFIQSALRRGDVPVSPGCALFRMADMRENLLLAIPSPFITDFLSHGAGPDLLLYLLTARRYENIAYLHEPLTFFRDHGGSISVQTRRLYLLQCYRQARLWFARSYLDVGSAAKQYAYEWRRECKEQKKWQLPSSVLGKYSDERINPTLLDLVRALFTK